MKRIYHIITMISIFAMLSGCYKLLPKPGPSETKYHLIPQTVLDYTYFKQGTYWVYQDSGTGKLDSQWVEVSYRGLDTFSKYSSYFSGYYQNFEYYIFDTLNNTEMRIYCSMTQSSYGYDAFVGRDISSTKYGIADCPMFYYPFNLARYSPTPINITNDTVYITPLISLNVIGNIYTNIVRINQFDWGYNQYTNSYIGKNMGVVKLQLLKEHKTWDLIRYHIVQ